MERVRIDLCDELMEQRQRLGARDLAGIVTAHAVAHDGKTECVVNQEIVFVVAAHESDIG